MAYSIGNKTALMYGLFSWQQNGQQNGFIIWLIQLNNPNPKGRYVAIEQAIR